MTAMPNPSPSRRAALAGLISSILAFPAPAPRVKITAIESFTVKVPDGGSPVPLRI